MHRLLFMLVYGFTQVNTYVRYDQKQYLSR